MRLPAIAFVIALVTVAAATILSRPAQPETECPSMACRTPTPPRNGEALLEAVHRCVDELYEAKTGVGGNRLRFDAMSMRPHGNAADSPLYALPRAAAASSWHVRIEEEHPHTTIPNGVEFTVDADTGKCNYAPMD